MEEQWGLSVKLFGKTILVVPTSKGADTAQVCSDELLKHAELNSPVAKLTETEEEIAVGSEVEYADRKPESGRGGGEEETEDEDPDELQLPQQEEKQREDDDDEIQKKEAAATEAASTKEEKEENDDKKTTMMEGKKKQAAEKPDKNKILPCPRCKSDDTKFCYYNNYNVNQPRHFCRNCQRYWTAGGTMRNVPVGAGRRKSKSAVVADASNSLYVLMLRHQQQQQQLQNGYITAEAAALHQPSIMHTNKASTVLSFSPSAPVACVNPIGHVNSPTQTAPGVVLVYSSGAGASTPTARTAAIAGNQFFPSCFNNFTNDQKQSQQLYYHNKSTMNVTNPPPNPNCASKFEPWMPPPTSSAQRVPVWQQPMHLGKHMRDGENNVKGDVKQRRLEDDDEDGRHRSIWVPKALRITDTPDAAASSSIWTTISGSGLGFNKKDQNHCGKMAPAAALERGFFNAFHTKENQVAASTTRPNKDNRGAVLSANPAAVARSHQFQETV